LLLGVASSAFVAGFDVAHGEVEDLVDGVVGGELAAGLGYLAQLVVGGLDRVGCVNHAADVRWQVEEGHELGPGPPPHVDAAGQRRPTSEPAKVSRACSAASTVGAA